MPGAISITVLFVSTCCFSFLHAQKPLRFERETFDASKFKLFEVEVDAKRKDLPVHFSSITLIDNRADASKMGFVRAGTKNEDHRFVFPGKGLEYLSEKVNKMIEPYSTANGDMIELSLNSLWLSQTVKQSSVLKKAMLGSNDLSSNCYINADVFVKEKDGTKHLGTIDTTLSTSGWIANACHRVLRRTLLTTLEICDSFYRYREQLVVNKPPEHALSYPILLADKPVKGLYRTYQEFLDNKPSIREFYPDTKAITRIVKTPNLPDSMAMKCWGYSDETGTYINIDKDFYKLNRSGHTFDLLGPQVIEIRNTMFAKIFYTVVDNLAWRSPYVDLSNMLEPSYRKLLSLQYYQLNIRDGLVR
jgi:hypothetical protein